MGPRLQDLPESVLDKIFGGKKFMKCRAVCRDMREKAALFGGVKVMLTKTGAKDVTADFCRSFQGHNVSIGCRGEWDPAEHWLDVVLHAVKLGLKLEELLVMVREQMLFDLLTKLLSEMPDDHNSINNVGLSVFCSCSNFLSAQHLFKLFAKKTTLRLHILKVYDEDQATTRAWDVVGLLVPVPGRCSEPVPLLHALDLSYYCLGGEGGRALAACLSMLVTLRSLDLNDTGMGGDGCTAIARSLYSLTDLLRLNLDSNGLGDDGFNAIAETLPSLTRLTELSLRNNHHNFEYKGMDALAAALRILTNLKALHLSHNGGFRGLPMISLSGLSALETLALDSMKLGDGGTTALSDILPRLQRLRILNLSNDFIGLEGAEHLAQALPCLSRTLRTLDLGHNCFRFKGGNMLYTALCTLTGLRRLDLSFNGLHEPPDVAKALRRLTNLRTLSLCGNSGDGRPFVRPGLGGGLPWWPTAWTQLEAIDMWPVARSVQPRRPRRLSRRGDGWWCGSGEWPWPAGIDLEQRIGSDSDDYRSDCESDIASSMFDSSDSDSAAADDVIAGFNTSIAIDQTSHDVTREGSRRGDSQGWVDDPDMSWSPRSSVGGESSGWSDSDMDIEDSS